MGSPGQSIPCPDNLKATAILDFESAEVRDTLESLGTAEQADRSWLQRAHHHLCARLRPVYSVNERQPASVTLRKGQGSCSQRMACLEAVARAARIATRVRALRVKGTFWYPRFRFSRPFIPKSILLLWPQFHLEGLWVDFDELHAPMERLAAVATQGFGNNAESLFEAVHLTPVDLLGKTCKANCPASDFDLSNFVLADEGFFDTRDEAFERFGSFQHTLRGRLFEAIYGGRKSS